MKHSIYFANNNEDIRSELESRGFSYVLVVSSIIQNG